MQNNLEIFAQAKKFIEGHSRFLLASHARTDGDDGGSMLAMTMYLQSLGKEATPVAVGGVPPSLQFLPNQNQIKDHLPNQANLNFYDAIILFGCGKKERVGFEEIIESKLPLLNIDHHPDNRNYGDINLVDPKKSSVAELVYDFLKYCGVQFNTDMARCLLTGIFTDTGSFMHSNTQASTLTAAAQLMKTGARVDKIHEFTYQNKNLSSFKAWAKAIENAQLANDGRIAICVLTEEDLAKLGPIEKDAFDGLVETINKIPGIKFAMFLRQEGNMVKGSVRSEENKNTDVSFLARMLGGGGHKLAAGFEIPGKIMRDPDGGWHIDAIRN